MEFEASQGTGGAEREKGDPIAEVEQQRGTGRGATPVRRRSHCRPQAAQVQPNQGSERNVGEVPTPWGPSIPGRAVSTTFRCSLTPVNRGPGAGRWETVMVGLSWDSPGFYFSAEQRHSQETGQRFVNLGG